MARLWRSSLTRTGARKLSQELRTRLAPHIHLRRCVSKESYDTSKRDVTELGTSLAPHQLLHLRQCVAKGRVLHRVRKRLHSVGPDVCIGVKRGLLEKQMRPTLNLLLRPIRPNTPNSVKRGLMEKKMRPTPNLLLLRITRTTPNSADHMQNTCISGALA